jgi:hypothetical protein
VAETGTSKRLWIAASLVGVALIVGAIVAFLITHHTAHAPTRPTAGGPSATPVSSPSPLPQAKWRVRAFPAGVVGHVTKKDLKAVRRQESRASHAIKNVYNALLLEPSDLKRVTRVHFEHGAGRVFLHTHARLPGPIRRVRTTRRSLQIGIDAKSASQAVATVFVSFKGQHNSRKVKINLKSTLWLERSHRSWKVLAWRAQQRPRR